MACEFINKGKCFISKKECETPVKIVNCKFYNRQYPSEAEYLPKFKKALEKALRKRDIFNEYNYLLNTSQPDMSKSIYDNIKTILDKIEAVNIVVKEKRNLTTEDLEGNILKNIATKLYNVFSLKVLQKIESKNELVVEENGVKKVYKVKSPVKEVISKLKTEKDNGVYLRNQISKAIKIK
jgi:hypothetical protein